MMARIKEIADPKVVEALMVEGLSEGKSSSSSHVFERSRNTSSSS